MKSLRIVAYLFMIGGIAYAADMVFEPLFLGRLTFNVGFLGFFIGRGLLRGNPRSLSWAIVLTWISLIGLACLAIVMLRFKDIPFDVGFFGLTLGATPSGFGEIACAALFAFTWWQLNVLKQPEVRQWFAGGTA